jgi:hypothetical protein
MFLGFIVFGNSLNGVFRLNENTIKNGNFTKFANGYRRVLSNVTFRILKLQFRNCL